MVLVEFLHLQLVRQQHLFFQRKSFDTFFCLLCLLPYLYMVEAEGYLFFQLFYENCLLHIQI